MDLVSIPGGTYELGWRHRPEDAALSALEEFVSLAELEVRHSPPRTVHLSAFEITASCVKLADLTEARPDLFEDASSLSDYCDATDVALKDWGFRLPTEDEFEAAFGPSSFPWGDAIPGGIPYSNQTQFRGHFLPSARGLIYNPSTYVGELVRAALKLGDGGEAVCGAYPWPMAWLSFCPAYRIGGDVDFLHEYLEGAEVRRVKLQ